MENEQHTSDGSLHELRSENLVKIYGKRTVVDHVSFNVRQGEIVGLLGPNGAGKTTSFYMTTGLVIPNEGHIFLDGEDVTTLPVYQASAIWPRRPVCSVRCRSRTISPPSWR